MSTLAYLRVSKDTQDVTHQRLAILEFARRGRRCPQCGAGSTRRGVDGVL
jgi:hypothetical protein